MNVTIGIRGGAHELHLELKETEAELQQLVEQTQKDDALLSLTTSKGHHVMIPARALGYVVIATEEPHRVGFNLS